MKISFSPVKFCGVGVQNCSKNNEQPVNYSNSGLNIGKQIRDVNKEYDIRVASLSDIASDVGISSSDYYLLMHKIQLKRDLDISKILGEDFDEVEDPLERLTY